MVSANDLAWSSGTPRPSFILNENYKKETCFEAAEQSWVKILPQEKQIILCDLIDFNMLRKSLKKFSHVLEHSKTLSNGLKFQEKAKLYRQRIIFVKAQSSYLRTKEWAQISGTITIRAQYMRDGMVRTSPILQRRPQNYETAKCDVFSCGCQSKTIHDFLLNLHSNPIFNS